MSSEVELLLRLDNESSCLHFLGQTYDMPVWQPPLSSEDLEEIRWYLEDYSRDPNFHQQLGADQVSARFRRWGEILFEAVVSPALEIWHRAITLEVPPILIIESQDANKLSLPFELLCDPKTGAWIVDSLAGIVRRAESQESNTALSVEDRIRVLVVAPRPYRPDVPLQVTTSRLAHLMENRGVELRVVRPPTFRRMKELLEQGNTEGKPWQIIIFDGHGAIKTIKNHKHHGLIFNQKNNGGGTFWLAKDFSELIVNNGVKVALLNACQSAKAITQSTHLLTPDAPINTVASYALELSKSAKIPVVAMSHKVLVETASSFTIALLNAWFNGVSLVSAMREARTALRINSNTMMNQDKVSMNDWIVPTLYGNGTLKLTDQLPAAKIKKETL